MEGGPLLHTTPPVPWVLISSLKKQVKTKQEKHSVQGWGLAAGAGPFSRGAAPSLRESLHGWLMSGTRPSWAQLRSALRCQAAASREEAVAVAPCTLGPGGAGLQGPPALPRAGPSQPLELSRQGDPQHGLLARRRLPGVWSRALSLPCCDVGKVRAPHSLRAQQGFRTLGLWLTPARPGPGTRGSLP